MTTAFSLLMDSDLFSGISSQEFSSFLSWLAPIERHYQKGQVVVNCGLPFSEFGFVLEGELEGIKPLADGRQMPVGHFLPGNVFGDVLAFGYNDSPVNITAIKASRILLFSPQSLLKTDCPVPNAQVIFMQNLLAVSSSKYFELNRRLDLLVIKSLRNRIGAFLLSEAKLAKNNTFCIRFNRVQLAEYLCCDRSALCREISRMKQEGILECYKSSFRLLLPHKLQISIQEDNKL